MNWYILVLYANKKWWRCEEWNQSCCLTFTNLSNCSALATSMYLMSLRYLSFLSYRDALCCWMGDELRLTSPALWNHLPSHRAGQDSPSRAAGMYQEVAFLAGSTDHQFTTFQFKRLENPQEVTSKKGLFYKRAQLLLQPQSHREDGGEIDLADGAAIINVGGIKYHIPWSTLDEFPLTRLGKLRACSNEAEIMDVCDDYDGSCNEYFFDRNPSAFRIIVTFLAAGKLRLLREMCALSFQEELLYWGVEENNLDWCCLRKLRLRQEEYKEQQRLEEEEGAELNSPQSCEETQQPVEGPEETFSGGCMRRLRDMVENPHSGLPGKIFACLSVLFVAITAVTLCVSTMPDLREEEERVSSLQK